MESLVACVLGKSNQPSGVDEAVSKSNVSLFGGNMSHDDGEYTEENCDDFEVDLVEGELIQIQR